MRAWKECWCRLTTLLLLVRPIFGEIPVVADNGANAAPHCSWRYPDSAGDFNPERIIIDDVIVASEPQVSVVTFNGSITVSSTTALATSSSNTAPLPGVTSGRLIRDLPI